MLTHIAASQNSQYSSRGNGQVIGEASPTPPLPPLPKTKKCCLRTICILIQNGCIPRAQSKMDTLKTY